MYRFFIIIILFLLACEQETPRVLSPVPGKVEVFNSCGIQGAANEVVDSLRRWRFDVLGAKTDPVWANYKETIIAIRNPYWVGDTVLRSMLNTENFIVLQDTSKGNIDVTIFVGKDYKKVWRKK